MKNYTYGWKLENLGYVEISIDDYTCSMLDMREYIKLLSNVIVKAKCGWSSVEYKAMRHDKNGDVSEYMVLCVDGHGERYIPISGNSKGANFQVLGENLW